MNKLKIIGLGRCIIGHLHNSINDLFSDEIEFKHHYLLNYNSCLKSTVREEEVEKIQSLHCKPTMTDQLFSLKDIIDYDICAIEIFPPAELYTNGSIVACFEDFTNDLKKAGFSKTVYDDKEYNENYVKTIEHLVEKIKERNKKIKIILVNGEIASQGEHNVGSLRLLNLLENVKTSSFLKSDFIKLLDMNELVESLEKKKYATFETAFPHIYIRYTNKFKVIEVSRDTKHAIPQVRQFFLKYFCTLIEDFDVKMPIIEVEKAPLVYFNKKLHIRGKNYLTTYNASPNILNELKNSKVFSLFTSYSLITKNKDSYIHIVDFIENLSLTNLKPEDLKLYFYHMRSVCAFETATSSGISNLLIIMANQITLFSKIELENCSNFALLWIKNIYLVYSNLEDSNLDKVIQNMKSFSINLSKNKFLMNFDEIQFISKYTIDIINKNLH